MSIYDRLREHESTSGPIRVAVLGAGFVGRGLVRQLARTPGMRPAIVVNRTPEHAVTAYREAGADDVLVDDDPQRLALALAEGRPAVATAAGILAELDGVDVVFEATGAVGYGAEACLTALESGKHVVSMNYETDATVGALLRRTADAHGVVYGGSDGDQPGVMARLVDYVGGLGLDVVAAVNCKGFLDVHATPETIAPWAERQRTSLPMTTAFTDGTKMNVENACVANATGLLPERRGMHGVETTMARALEDFAAAIETEGVVDYTLGGDFGGGVFVIGHTDDPDDRHYLGYLKMGRGPWYLFYRPWHLVHFEAPLSIAETVLDRQPTITPMPVPVAEVVAVAKRDLRSGELLDGIGGYTTYGQIATVEEAHGFLPVGLTGHARVVGSVPADEPVPLDAVELDEEAPLVRLRRRQDGLVRETDS